MPKVKRTDLREWKHNETGATLTQPARAGRPQVLGKFRSFTVVKASTSWNDRHGECSKADQTVVLGRHLRGQGLLDTTIHELLHAADWDLTEKFVDRAATDIAAFLWKQGWRPTTKG